MIYIVFGVMVIFIACLSAILKQNEGHVFQKVGFHKYSFTPVNIGYQFSMWMCVIGLTLLSGLRYYVGTDYQTYAIDLASQYANGTSEKEYLFGILTKISLSMGDIQWLFMFSSAIIVGFSVKAIYDQTNNVGYGLFLFVSGTFYNFSMNAVRQAMATAIFLYAIKYIQERKMIPYFFWILLASGFHQTALMYLPIYFLGTMSWATPKKIAGFGIISIVCFILKMPIRSLIYIIVNTVTPYGAYFGSQFDSDLSYISYAFLFINMGILVFLEVGSLQGKLQESDNVLINVQLILTIFSAISFVIPASFRIFYFFTPVQCILLPNVLSRFENIVEKMLAYLSITFGYSFLFWFFILQANYNATLPYAVNGFFLNSIRHIF